jgi:hypothetical protein
MRRHLGRFPAAILLVALTLSGCAYMTKSGREQMAYRHYLNKHIRQRQKQIARAQKAANRDLKRRLKFIHPSEPIISASVEDAGPTSDPGAPPPPAPGETNDGPPGP